MLDNCIRFKLVSGWPVCIYLRFFFIFQHRDPMLKKRDDFEDILEERRRSSDLRYALKCYTPVLYKGLVPCKAHMLKGMVLQSDQLRHVISQVKATGETEQKWIVLVQLF